MATYTIFAGVNGAGKSIVRNIKKAKEKGFYVVMNYIGLDTPDIAKERVKIRVLKGGHGIPEDAIERRYYESLENLKELLNDRIMNDWLHVHLYKYQKNSDIGELLRKKYNSGEIKSEFDFKEVLKSVLSSSQEI